MNLDALWKEFQADFLPPEAPAGQVKQLKIAFYAGASAATRLVGETQDTKEPTRAHMIAAVTMLVGELGAFAVDGKFQ
jgi:hypothetical protein